ncbi:MAG: asparagine synthase (glutamine-hydrolyzing) [Candidatus Omnitrophica bacterium]|nr:asparagine synthase (glutamine-hydrolyzing) [Candidatus Omnitrophota bacterium]
MCGICGKVTLNNSSSISEELIRKMCSTLVHRGPDDEGVYISRQLKVGLGHRRLSIIDLSTAGHQPMSNEDGTIWIVLNGEIYNFLELRKILEAKGHRFKSHTDTEVVLHLYEEKGIDCLADLRGPFAFAVWDEKKERLFAARDRIGKKPFVYFYKSGTLIFASEIKALLEDPEVPREVNRSAITDYLTYGYTPTPESMFAGIRKLPPACFMIFEKGNIKLGKYWQLDFSKKINLGENEYCDKIKDLLEEATRLRLVSDVPLGVFLSGGMDSSTIVYLMTKINAGKVKTFSIGFDEADYSELKYARIVAKRFNTEHHEYIVKPHAIELLPTLVWHYDEPYADSSALPSYYVAKMTRQEVKVALNGDGGDEDFGGYERFMAARYAELFRKLPPAIRNTVMGSIPKMIPDSLPPNTFLPRLKRFILMASRQYQERHYNWVSIFRDFEKESLFTDEFKRELNGKNSFAYLNAMFTKYGTADIVDSVMLVDIMTNLLDDLIVKMDIATMANSLEARSPFLDHKVMEFAASIPSGIKIKGIKLKYLLKKSMADILPKEILARQKMGFGIPRDKWFRTELKDYAREILLSPESIRRNYFKESMLRRLLDEHSSGRANHGAHIWSLLNLELWHRIFIDKDITA